MNEEFSESVSESETETDAPTKPKPGIFAVIMAVLLTLFLVYIGILRTSGTGGPGVAIGVAIGSVVPALVILALFQIGKCFRNARSQWRIFAWSQFFVVLGQINLALQGMQANL